MHNVKHKMYFYKKQCIICNFNDIGTIRSKHEQTVISQRKTGELRML